MAYNSIYDSNYWYVVNTEYKHIVYRSKKKDKAVHYAEQKNGFTDSVSLHYQVVSGAVINQMMQNLTAKKMAYN